LSVAKQPLSEASQPSARAIIEGSKGPEILVTQIVYSNAHLNPFEGVFSDKPFIIAAI
jgi:hypothetical protein